jgi:hypothetical protein
MATRTKVCVARDGEEVVETAIEIVSEHPRVPLAATHQHDEARRR